MTRLTLVVPCYNEGARLDTEAFLDYASRSPTVEFLFVDDGSTDDTTDVLSRMRDRLPSRVHVLTLDTNQGKAEAVRRGILEAMESDPEFVGYWDADLATPLDSLAAFVQCLTDDPRLILVMGSRVRLLGRQIHRSAVRHYSGRVFATVVSLLLRWPVYDTQCGAKIFRTGSTVRELFDAPFLSRWIFDVELLARLDVVPTQDGQSLAEAVYELPLASWIGVAGSKVRLVDYARALADLVRIRRAYPRLR